MRTALALLLALNSVTSLPAAAQPASAPPVAATASFAGEAVILATPTGRLGGTLLLPPDAGPRTPVVLILPGSGPNDRDGDAPALGLRSGHLRLLAESLAARGVGSLRVDKRGVGESAAAGAEEASLRFEHLVSDANAWLGWIAGRRPEAPVVVLGHSEGGLVGTLAARGGTRVSGLILVAPAGRPAADLLREQFTAGLPEPMRTEALAALDALGRGEPVANVSGPLNAMFRPSVQPYLRSWLPLDPAAELARVRAPVLVVRGSTDLQVSAADVARLTAARPGVEALEVAGMNHILKAAPADRAANAAAYGRPDLPLAPGLIEPVVAFTRRTAGLL